MNIINIIITYRHRYFYILSICYDNVKTSMVYDILLIIVIGQDNCCLGNEITLWNEQDERILYTGPSTPAGVINNLVGHLPTTTPLGDTSHPLPRGYIYSSLGITDKPSKTPTQPLAPWGPIFHPCRWLTNLLRHLSNPMPARGD